MKILGIIPARSGSKGIENKNIKPIKNIPLLEFSVFTGMKCKEAGLLSDVIVSTDSKEYLDIIKDYKIEKGYLRPKTLAEDNTPTIDVIIDLIDWYKLDKDVTFDAVMLLQPTSPFRTLENINDAIKMLKQNPDLSCVTLISKLEDHHPLRIKRIDEDNKLVDFNHTLVEPEPSRRQDFTPSAYIRNGAIYLSPIKSILEKRAIRGNNIGPIIMKQSNSINIDEHLDYLIANTILDYEPFAPDLEFFNELLKKNKK